MNSLTDHFDEEFMAEMMAEFFDESSNRLAQLGANLLEVDEKVRGLRDDEAVEIDSEVLNEMFRAAHSIKGLSAMLNLTDVNQLTHRLESLLDASRQGRLPMNRNIVDVMLTGVDRLSALIDLLADPSRPPVEYEEILQKISRLLDQNISAAPADSLTPLAQPHPLSSPPPPLAVADPSSPPVAATLIASPPDAPPPVAGPVATESFSTPPSPSANVAAASSDATKGRANETLRVDIERLDQLMNLAGQLVINKARFGRLGDQLKGITRVKQASQSLARLTNLVDRVCIQAEAGLSSSSVDRNSDLQNHLLQIKADLSRLDHDLRYLTGARTVVVQLSEAVHQLDRVSSGIQQSVMDMRMVPIGPLFNRFKRVIRDVTRLNGKDVRLEIRGEKTELDKRMIDELADPLNHMIRNAADHGIETEEVRRAQGKPAFGTVVLDAFHRGNRIVVQIKDDGKGLDPEKIRGKALSLGLVTAQDLDRMTTSQIYQLIWEPGFSTAERVTEVSGRGVGMDIVRSKIEELNGTIELDSQPGVGTTFTIKLPLTMAILPSLLVEVDQAVFAVPVESVIEIVSLPAGALTKVHGVLAADVRGRVISVKEIADLFGWTHASHAPGRVADSVTLVIVGVDGNQLGLFVDRLIGEEDIVIKSLADNYHNVLGIAGASILGDGRVSLILDVGALFQLASRPRGVSGQYSNLERLESVGSRHE